MGRSRKSVRLSVVLNGRLVGVLNRAANGAVSFAYDTAWLQDTRRVLPISRSLPLREEPYLGAEVLAFFDNLLPDIDSIRRQVAERVKADGIDAFSLLNQIGRDCVGALQFLPEGENPQPPCLPESTPLSDAEIADIIRNLASAPLGVRPDGERELRISIAGAQEKTALLWDQRWCLPKANTSAPKYGSSRNGRDREIGNTRRVSCSHAVS